MLIGMAPDDSLALFNLRAQHRFGVLQDESENEGGTQDDRTITVECRIKIFCCEQDLHILIDRMWDVLKIDYGIQNEKWKITGYIFFVENCVSNQT